MIDEKKMFNVKNRSSSIVVYRIPETGLRREFAVGETKRIPFGELEKLTYQPGGKELIEQFLQILDDEVADDLNVNREPEYNMSEAEVKNLLLNGSLDAFLDALDFAPLGVIDLIKSMSVSLPLTDLNKRRELKNKTGFDVDKALIHIEEEKAEENAGKQESTAAPTRRVQPASATPGRRTTPKYNVVKKADDTASDKE